MLTQTSLSSGLPSGLPSRLTASFPLFAHRAPDPVPADDPAPPAIPHPAPQDDPVPDHNPS